MGAGGMGKAGYTSTWIGLTSAIERVASMVGRAEAWPQIKLAIRDGALRARGLFEGVEVDLRGKWLSVLAFDDHDADILWFDLEKVADVDFGPPPPEHAEQVEVDGEQVARLWPTGSVTSTENNNSTGELPGKPDKGKAGRPRHLFNSVKEKLVKIYPEGVPENEKLSVIQAKLKEEGVPASEKTIGRVLKEIAGRVL